MGKPELTILGLSPHTTTEAEVLWRAKGIELAASEQRLIEWLQAKPDNEALRQVYLDYSYLLQMFTEANTAIGLLKDRNSRLSKALDLSNEEIRRLGDQLDELRQQSI